MSLVERRERDEAGASNRQGSSADNSARLAKLRKELRETLINISNETYKILDDLIKAYRGKFKKEPVDTIVSLLDKRECAASVLEEWMGGSFPNYTVRADIYVKDDGIEVSFTCRRNDWEIASVIFPPDTSLQEVVDWFLHSREVFEKLVDAIGPAWMVSYDKQVFEEVLEVDEAQLNNPFPDLNEFYIIDGLKRFRKLYEYVEKFDQLIKEFRELVGWREEEGES